METGLRSVSSRQGSRNIRDIKEHTDLGTVIADRLSDSKLVETTRYRVQVINSSMSWKKNRVEREDSVFHFCTNVHCTNKIK